MTGANLAIARKVILCVGLLVSALLFTYPHWIDYRDGSPHPFDKQDLGRAFIWADPLTIYGSERFSLYVHGNRARIDRRRQITEAALALLFTFGALRLATFKALPWLRLGEARRD